MLQLLNAELHGYTGAALDAEGNPYKIVCDVLNVVAYSIDSNTSPNASLIVTYERVDPDNNFVQGGPYTQHLITGQELIQLLEVEGGITVDQIDESVLSTGIPSAGIRPEDLAPYPEVEHWNKRMIEKIKKRMEELKKMEAQRMQVPFSTVGPFPNA